MDTSPSSILILAGFLVSFGIGAILLTAIVVDRFPKQAILTIIYSLFAAALFVFGNIKDPHVANAAAPSGQGINLAFIANNTVVTLLVLGLATLIAARLIFSANSKWRDQYRKKLIPALWASPGGSAEIAEDVERRWYVTVAAATGNIIGIRITDVASLQVLRASITFERIFIVAVISVIAFILIGPGEELLLGTAESAESENSPPRSPFMEMIHATTAQGWAKWIGIFVCVALINVGEKCMDDALSSGHAQSALQMILAAAPAGVVTYYWCAAIQRRTKTVADAVFEPSIIVATFLTIGLVFAIAIGAAYMTYEYQSLKHGSLAVLALLFPMVVILLFLLAAAFLMLNLVQYGIVSAAGGVVIDADRLKPARSSYLTIARVMGLIIVIQAFSIAALFGFSDFVLKFFAMKTSDQAFGEALLSVVGTMFWGLGLVIARFPKVLERGRHVHPAAPASP